jgi:ligand-binding sensor domain-containing protein/serine phosphatase RsbU (regulator of sigma subunit)
LDQGDPVAVARDFSIGLIGWPGSMRTSLILALAPITASAAPFESSSTLTPTPRFERLNLEDGLPQLSSYAIVQDRAGFLWFGTGDGLARYDGYAFKVFQKDAAEADRTVSDSVITALFDGHGGALWIGTGEGGLNRYDHDTQRFAYYHHEPQDSESISSEAITAIFEDDAGLWVGTKLGLNRFDEATGKFKRLKHDPVDRLSLIDDSVLALHGRANRVWVGTSGGLALLDTKTLTFTRYAHDPDDPKTIASNTVTAVLEDREGIVWIGTDGGGLDRLDPRTGVIRHFRHNPSADESLSDDRVRVVFEDRAGRLWVGTQGQLNLFDRKAGRFLRFISDANDETTLPYPWVASLFEDASGVLWVGTWGGGVGKLDLASLEVELYKSGSTFAFDEAADGTMWIGEHVGGLAHFDRERQRITRYKPTEAESVSIHAVHVAKDGAVWAGTFGKGLRRFDPRTSSFRTYEASDEVGKLNSDVVFDIHEDTDGKLWLGTWGGGLVKLDPKEEWFTYYIHDQYDPEGISSSYVYTIRPDAQDANVLWIGTANGGLNRFDKQKESFESYKNDPKNADSISHNNVLTIHEKDGVLWLGTYGGGLNRFDKATKKFEAYTTKQGLAHNFVFGILEDADGFLWLSTNKGINKLDPANMTFARYDQSDGLQGMEFSQGAYFRSKKTGELFFGGVRGFNVFDPKAMAPDPYVPPVVITTFQISNEEQDFGRPIANVDRVELDYDQPLFSLEFAALSFAATKKNSYKYRLEGLHDDWLETRRRFVSYSNLDPGDYVFRVMGSNRHGTWNEEGAKLAIHVNPPPWRTWWAYALYAVIVAGIVFAYVRYNEQRVQRLRQAARLQTVEKDLELASAVQTWFLPEDPVVASERFRLLGYFRPADQCSGDWWWYEKLPDGSYWVVVGDVTGHGAGPAVLTAAVATALRIQKSAAQRPAGGMPLALSVPNRLEDVSNEILDVCAGKYHMTMTSVVIDETRRRLHFYGTGGLPMLALKPDGKVKSIGAPGTPLGVTPFKLGEVEVEMAAGDRILIMTDGIPETVTKNGRMFGMRRCQELLERTRGMSLEDSSKLIEAEVDASRRGAQDDDMTFVLIDWLR